MVYVEMLNKSSRTVGSVLITLRQQLATRL